MGYGYTLSSGKAGDGFIKPICEAQILQLCDNKCLSGAHSITELFDLLQIVYFHIQESVQVTKPEKIPTTMAQQDNVDQRKERVDRGTQQHPHSIT